MFDSLIQGVCCLMGRILLVLIFLNSTVNGHIPRYFHTVMEMRKEGVPYAAVSLGIAVAMVIFGSVSVLAGYKSRYGSLMLLIFLVLATYYYHDFWKYPVKNALYAEQFKHFMKNLSIAGGLIFIIGNGAGAWSLSEEPIIPGKSWTRKKSKKNPIEK